MEGGETRQGLRIKMSKTALDTKNAGVEESKDKKSGGGTQKD